MDQSVERLRAIAGALSSDELDELIAQARAEARERVRAALVEAMTESLMEQVAAGHEPRAIAQHEELAWYVYGVVRADDVELPDDLTGVETGLPVGLVREDGLAAVASQVAGSEFDEAQLRAHLGDMEWVQAVARAHEAVLHQIANRSTVIPMRMCTVYRTEGGVREMLRREAGALREALEHLEGKTEWGVKVLADATATIGDRDDATDGLTTAAEGSGAAYMDRKRREREDAERAAERVEQACAEIHEALCALASDALLAPPQRPEAHGLAGEMVLNGVYLVRDEDQAEFHECIDALTLQYGALGLTLERTGPWPGYNFVPGTLGAAW